MRTNMIDPRAFKQLKGYFPDRVSIHGEGKETRNEYNEIVYERELIYEDKPANKAPTGGDDVRDGNSSHGYFTYTVTIPEVLEGISAGMTLTVKGEATYQVVSAEIDSLGVQTRIKVEGREIDA